MCTDAELTFETLRMIKGCPHIILIFFTNSVISHILETSSSYFLLGSWEFRWGKCNARVTLSITPKKFMVVSWQQSFSSSYHHHDVLLHLCKCLMFFSTPLVRERKKRGSIACSYVFRLLEIWKTQENKRGAKKWHGTMGPQHLLISCRLLLL